MTLLNCITRYQDAFVCALEQIKQNAKFIRSTPADTLKPACPQCISLTKCLAHAIEPSVCVKCIWYGWRLDYQETLSKNIFIVHEFHNGEFTPGDIGKPILAFDKPIGLVTIVTDNEICGIVQTQYYDDWRRHGRFIQVPNVNETSSSSTKG